MKSLTWFISKRLMVEQRYLAMKNSTKFQNRISRADTNKTRYLETYINSSYAVSAFSFIFFSVFLTAPYAQAGQSYLRMADISFLLFLYAFIISIYSSILFINTLQGYRLIEPIKPMPLKISRHVIPLSWFAYTGSTAVFVVAPALILYTWIFRDPFTIVFGLIWTILVIVLGFTAGSGIFIFLGSRFNQKRSSVVNSLKGILRIVFIIVIFIIFEMGVYFPDSLPDIIPAVHQPVSWFIPFLNIAYIVFMDHFTLEAAAGAVVSTAIYAAVIAFLFSRISRRLFEKISDQGLMGKSERKSWREKFSIHGFYQSFFIKEIRLIARKSQNVIFIFIPIFFILPTIFSIFLYGDPGQFSTLSTYYSLLSIVVVCASFYSLILIISEGNGIEILFSLPLALRKIIYSKGLVGLAIFSAIIVPVTIILTGTFRSFHLYDLLIPANLIAAYAFASMFNIRHLIRKVPRGASTVNFYSFGGNIAFITLFILSSVFTLAPVGAATLITYVLHSNPFSNNALFYSLDAIFNGIMLLIVLNIVDRT